MHINQFKENLFTHYTRNLNLKYSDLLKYEIDQRIYYYGDHYLFSKERKNNLLTQLKSDALNQMIAAYVFLKSQKGVVNIPKILSTAYHNIPEKFEKEKIAISRPPWNYNKQSSNVFNYSLHRRAMQLSKQLESLPFDQLFSVEFSDLIEAFSNQFQSFLTHHQFVANFVPADVGFFDKLSIKVSKSLEIPSFLFIHGLPAGYNSIDNNGTDYVVVWGEAIKRNFVKNGIDHNKIIVAGHPIYRRPLNHNLRFDLNEILIVTKSIPGSQLSNHYAVKDRSNLIYYLGSLQQVLESFGVKSVRLRPHPSESVEWYKKWIDNRFFKFDVGPLDIALKRSTLVIGPTSTLFVESLINGVNYIVYEPFILPGIGLDGGVLVPPFDGSDDRVPTANSAEELAEILVHKEKINLSVLADYISQEFDNTQILAKLTI